MKKVLLSLAMLMAMGTSAQAGQCFDDCMDNCDYNFSSDGSYKKCKYQCHKECRDY